MTHRFIFERHGKRFFRSLAKIYGWKRAKKIRNAEAFNVGKPPSKRRRVPYWRPVEPDSAESSETNYHATSTDSEDDRKCPFFERSHKITPHAVVHLADQVVMGGTHNFHNTAAQESLHPRCISQAALRSRTYNDVNVSSTKMLEYLVDKYQKEKIVELATQPRSCKYVVVVCHYDMSSWYVITICHRDMSFNYVIVICH